MTLDFDFQFRAERRWGGAVSIYRGPAALLPSLQRGDNARLPPPVT
jgi:hypothetical protein